MVLQCLWTDLEELEMDGVFLSAARLAIAAVSWHLPLAMAWSLAICPSWASTASLVSVSQWPPCYDRIT